MVALHLVRHGDVVPDAGPASGWALHPDAADGIADLRGSAALPVSARWFSSPEPKAFQTARALTDVTIGRVDGLREMSRPAERWRGGDEWRQIVRRSMEQPDRPALPDWETGRATTDRVVGAVGRIREGCPDDDVVLVGHGTAWTLLVSALTGRPPDFDAWTRLRMPDHCVLTLDDRTAGTGTLVAGWGQWALGSG
ncbi:histidine phosphatase family protein [Actinopolymorpha sp. B11F2]|uniref:histidine phosphatase family protein n=1 Tax=Actinopolymorpha sp. B11F2 TaxID=3160862 RepID=UPI0032E4C462